MTDRYYPNRLHKSLPSGRRSFSVPYHSTVLLFPSDVKIVIISMCCVVCRINLSLYHLWCALKTHYTSSYQILSHQPSVTRPIGGVEGEVDGVEQYLANMVSENFLESGLVQLNKLILKCPIGKCCLLIQNRPFNLAPWWVEYHEYSIVHFKYRTEFVFENLRLCMKG